MTPAPFHGYPGDPPSGVRAFWLRSEDGLRLRAAHWPAAQCRGSVLLMQGRAEYHEKYTRVAADLNAVGLDVLSVEWRGQGLSDRLIPRPFVSHIGRFCDYQRDVVELVVAAQDLDLPRPWHLLCHSMGGLIGLESLRTGLPVRSAAFCAPMWGIALPKGSGRIAGAIATVAGMLGRGASLAPGSGGSGPFVLADSFDENRLTTDGPEWARLIVQATQTPELVLGGVSYDWLRLALQECRRLATQPAPGIPALIGLAVDEAIVSNAAIRHRAGQWPDSRLIEIKGARHEPMIEQPAIRKRFMDAVIEHFTTTD